MKKNIYKKYIKKLYFNKVTIIISTFALFISFLSYDIAKKSFYSSLYSRYDAAINFPSKKIVFENIGEYFDIVRVDIIKEISLRGYVLLDYATSNHFKKDFLIKYETIKVVNKNKINFKWEETDFFNQFSVYLYDEIENLGNFWMPCSYYILVEYQNPSGDYKMEYFYVSTFTREEATSTIVNTIELNKLQRISLTNYEKALKDSIMLSDLYEFEYSEIAEELAKTE